MAQVGKEYWVAPGDEMVIHAQTRGVIRFLELNEKGHMRVIVTQMEPAERRG